MAKKGWRQAGLGPVLCGAALIYAPAAAALGLGPLTVDSNLGQPLQAHVRLLGFHAGDRRAIDARLASSSTFAQLGLRKGRVLRSIICRIRRGADGHYAIVLESRRIINAPFLQFVLQLKGPQGTLLREYTALLNPMTGVQPVAMSASRTPLPARELIAPRPLAVARQPSVAVAPGGGTGVVRVRPGETAWVIAARHTPAGALVPQTLEAFLRRNPGAFANHNVNELAAGAVLHVPSAQAVRAIPSAQAGSWFAAQNQAWGHYQQALATQPATAGTESRTIGGALRAAQILPASHNLLKIEAAPLPGTAMGTAGAAGKAGKGQALSERIVKLRKELSATRHLIALDNRELATLEQEAHAQQKPKNSVSGIVARPLPAPKVAPAIKPPVRAVVRPLMRRAPIVRPLPPLPPNPSFLSTLWREDKYALLLASLAVVAVGGLFYYRRKRSMNEFEESILSGGGLNTEAQMPDTANMAKTPEVSFLSEFSQGGTGNMQTDEVDPIAEADVYLAYGRDEQAEEILKEASSRDGARLELKVKLLEIYLQRHDLKTFEVLAEEIYAATNGTGALWERVEEMGYKIDPMNPLFKKGAGRDGNATEGARNAAADRIDFAAVARELEAVSAPAAVADRPGAGSLKPEPLEIGGAGQGLSTADDSLLDFSAGLGETKTADAGAGRETAAGSGPATIDFAPSGLSVGEPAAAGAGSGHGGGLDFGGADHAADAGLDFSWNGGTAVHEEGGAKREFALDFDEETPAAGASMPDLDFGQFGGSNATGELRDDDGLVLDLSDAGAEETQATAVAVETASGVRQATYDGVAAGGAAAVDTKLDLANAYIEMGDSEGARSILNEVLAEGNERQRSAAQALAARSAAH